MALKEVTILGSGTSTGVPVIGCRCAVCTSPDPKSKRTRASILLTTDQDENIVVDTGPEFRLQILREDVRHLDAVIYTHMHADHCHGFDDLRAFFFHKPAKLDCYLTDEHRGEMERRFDYAFTDTGYLGATPQLSVHTIEERVPFSVCGIDVESQSVTHGAVETSVFKFGRFLYATDFKQFTPEDIAHWRGQIDVAVASGIHFRTHATHSTIPETLELFEQLAVKRAYITHLSHEIDYLRDAAQLPEHVEFAYDGMKIDLTQAFT